MGNIARELWRIYCRIQEYKKIENRSTFAKVMPKNRAACFYLIHDIVAKLLGKPDDKVGRCEWERVGCV